MKQFNLNTFAFVSVFLLVSVFLYYQIQIYSVLTSKDLETVNYISEREMYEVFNKGLCFWGGTHNKGNYRVCPVIKEENGNLKAFVPKH